MRTQLRSKQGCWTCRLRKKKCDEAHPICSTCESLSITCYGYDAKPDWMDNGPKEKTMAANIKQVVKHTSRRKGARLGLLTAKLQRHSSGLKQRPDPVARLAPKLFNDVVHLPSPASSESPKPHEYSSRDSFSKQKSSTEIETPDTNSSFVPLSTIAGNESVLLMHYLDVVFYLQYPMYKSPVAEGGRGWLLSLLLRTKPLYHAALALSSYHRGAVILASQRNSARDPSNVVDQEKHLAKFFEEFQRSIKSVGRFVEEKTPGNCVGMLSCIVQLVFFELFANPGTVWKIHLQAATNMICDRFGDQQSQATMIDGAGVADSNRTSLHPIPTDLDFTIFSFFTGVVTWLDIVSSITGGNTPKVLALQSEISCPNSQRRLENIMGCKNWALFQIGRISALHESQANSREGNCSSAEEEMKSEIESIRQELVQGLNERGLSCLTLSDDQKPSYPSIYDPIDQITRIFALMACIYLHLVVLGLQHGSSCVDPTITEVMTILREDTSATLLPALVCPLYIIGCVAIEEDKQFFRDIFSSAPLLDPTLDHRSKILPLLEQVWILRANGPATRVTWSEILQLSNGNLLLI